MKKTFILLLCLFLLSLSQLLAQTSHAQTNQITANQQEAININGWKVLVSTQSNGHEILLQNSDNIIRELSTGSSQVPGLWKFENPELFIIYDDQSFQNSEHQFIIRKNNDSLFEFQVASYFDNEEILYTYRIYQLNKEQNTLNINQLEKTQKITVNGRSYTPYQTNINHLNKDELLFNLDIQQLIEDKNKSQFSQKNPLQNQVPIFPDLRSPILIEAVNYLHEQEIISGYPDGMFKPDQHLNRAEALKIILLSTANNNSQIIEDLIIKNSPYPDIPLNKWFTKYIYYGKELGLINGYNNGNFHPTQNVNKAEFLKIAMLSQNNFQSITNFEDIMRQYADLDSSQWYMPFIAYAWQQNLLPKTSNFYPTAQITRGEAALIIYKTITISE